MVKHILILPLMLTYNKVILHRCKLLIIVSYIKAFTNFGNVSALVVDADLTTGSTLLTRGWLPFLPRRATEGATTKN